MSYPTAKGDVFLTVRIPRELRDAITEIAKREDRTQAAEIRRAIQAHVKANQ
jgi:predicted transcriptional regulator